MLLFFFFAYTAALLSCTELVCAQANLNYANFFFQLKYNFDKGGSFFTKRYEHPARNRFELFSSSPFCNQNRNKRKLDNVRIRSPVRILRRNDFQTEFELFFRCFRRDFFSSHLWPVTLANTRHILRAIHSNYGAIKYKSATLPSPLRFLLYERLSVFVVN